MSFVKYVCATELHTRLRIRGTTFTPKTESSFYRDWVGGSALLILRCGRFEPFEDEKRIEQQHCNVRKVAKLCWEICLSLDRQNPHLAFKTLQNQCIWLHVIHFVLIVRSFAEKSFSQEKRLARALDCTRFLAIHRLAWGIPL